MEYLSFIQSEGVNELKQLIEKSLSEISSFKDVSMLPKEKGVYFIYDCESLVYIGEAGRGEKQTIRERCMQYLQQGTGRKFREKLMMDKELDVQESIEYIKEKCTIRYIIENKHKKLEHLAIGIFNTKYND